MQAMGVEMAGAQQVLPNPVADLAVVPGTRSDLALRVVQFVSATLAIVAMVSADDFFTASAFIFLVVASSLQTLWSLLLAILDAVVIVTGYPLQHHWAASKLIYGDMITGTLTFCAAAASLGVVLFLRYDIETCSVEHCTQFQNATARAFISFAAILPSLIIYFIGH